MTILAACHYITSFPRSIDNKDPLSDYYATQYLPPAGEGGAHASYGGYLRARPLGRAPIAGDWELEDMKWEVATAYSMHLDAFTVDLLELDVSGTTNSNTGHARRVRNLCKAADMHGQFKIILMPDMDAWKNATSGQVAATLVQLAKNHPSVYRENGRVIIAPYHPEASKPASFYVEVLNSMAGAGVPASIVPCFHNYEANVSNYKSVLGQSMVGASNWGNRTPNANPVAGNVARIADAHNRGLIWMQPVAFQDVRPDQAVFAEPCNTLNMRRTFQAAIDGKADWIQGCTWNDFREGTQLCPSTDHDSIITELFGWYSQWFKERKQPVIVHDSLILTHRKQMWNAKPTYPQTSLMASGWQGQPPQDTLEVLCRLTAPATVNLQSGSVVKTFTNVPAGVTALTMPLMYGIQKASMLR